METTETKICECRHYSEGDIKLSKKNVGKRNMAYAYIDSANSLYGKGKKHIPDMIKLLNQGLELCKSIYLENVTNITEVVKNFYWAIGHLHFELKEFQEALPYLGVVLDFYERPGNVCKDCPSENYHVHAKTILWALKCYTSLNMHDEILHTAKNAFTKLSVFIPGSRLPGDQHLVGHIWRQVYVHFYHFPTCATIIDKAIATNDAITVDAMKDFCFFKGYVSMVKKEYHEAISDFKEYIDYMMNKRKRKPSPEEWVLIAKTFGYIATCMNLWNNYGKFGIEELKKALKILEEEKTDPKDHFRYSVLIQLVLYSLNFREMDKFTNYFSKLLESQKVQYDNVLSGLRILDFKPGALFLNVGIFHPEVRDKVNTDFQSRRKWRIFKNTALITANIRKTMLMASNSS